MNPQSSQPSEASSSNTQTAHDQHGQYPQATTVDDFRHNLAAVHARIEAACQRVGRDPATVRLLPVSKTKGEEAIRAAYAAGCRFLGENKVQEAYGKWQAMQDLTDLKWSVIGHLQTNKAKVVARFAAEFQALDSLRAAEALDKRLQAEGRSLDVFVQVNTSGEPSKFGLSPEDVPAFVQALPGFSALRVRGLMTLALFSSEAERVRQCFILLRSLRDRARRHRPACPSTSCRWACRATTKSPSRKVRPSCAWARPSSVRGHCPTATTGLASPAPTTRHRAE